MAEEMTNVTGTAQEGAGAAQEGAQAQAGTEGTQAEQLSGLEKLLEKIGLGKKAEAAGEGQQAAAGTAQAGAADGKTYTQAEVDTMLEQKLKEAETRQQEAKRMEELTPEERAKAENEQLKSQLLRRDLKESATAALDKEGLPVGLADILDYSSKEKMEASLTKVQGTFLSCLQAAVNQRLRGKTPEGLGGAANTENAIKDEIAKNIRGGLN